MENSKGLKLVVLLVALLAIWNTYRIETVDGGSILDFQSDSLEELRMTYSAVSPFLRSR